MKNLILLFGGDSCENDISIITAFSTYKALKCIYNIIPIYIKNGAFLHIKNMQKIGNLSKITSTKFSEVNISKGKLKFNNFFKKSKVVFCAIICNHGGIGENGSLQGYLNIARIPYTSSDVFASSIFMDKEYTKNFVSGICDTVPFLVIHKDEKIDYTSINYPVIVKPARLGSSVGIGIAHNEEELKERTEFAFEFDNKIIIEKALTNFIELNCAAFRKGNKIIVSDIERPIFNNEYYDFDTKYTNVNTGEREFPAKIHDELASKIKELTETVYRRSEAKGVIRIDFLYNGKLYLNEVNTVPGSLAFYLFKNKNVDFKDLLITMIEEGVSDFMKKESLITSFDSCVLENMDSEKLFDGLKK